MPIRDIWNRARQSKNTVWETATPRLGRVRRWISARWSQVMRWGLTHLLLSTLVIYAGLMLLLIGISIWYVSPRTPDERNSVIQTIAQIGGGAVLLLGLYFTWRTVTTSDRNHQLLVKGQVFDRYTKLVEQLGNESQSLRIGAIYALEQLSRDSEDDYDAIIEVLAAFVRTQGRWQGYGVGPQIPKDDIQAAMTALGRRPKHAGNSSRRGLLLGQTDLRNLDLNGGHFESTRFEYSNLDGTTFAFSHLDRAIFFHTNLNSTYFVGASVQYASFTAANLEYAMFFYPPQSMIEELNNSEASPEFVDYWHKFSDTPPPSSTPPGNPGYGDLLRGADFRLSHLRDTDFRFADLSQVVGMTETQLDVTRTGPHTVRPQQVAVPTQNIEDANT